MNITQLYLKRIVYNSKLNREKFIINKKKINKIKSIQVRKLCTFQTKNHEPKNPDWLFMFIIALTGYSVGKFNQTKKGKYL